MTWKMSVSAGGLTQRADVGAEAGHSAAAPVHHSGGFREQLAGRSHALKLPLHLFSLFICNESMWVKSLQ